MEVSKKKIDLPTNHMYKLNYFALYEISKFLDKPNAFICVDNETKLIRKSLLYNAIIIQRWWRKKIIPCFNNVGDCINNYRKGFAISFEYLKNNKEKFKNRQIQFYSKIKGGSYFTTYHSVPCVYTTTLINLDIRAYLLGAKTNEGEIIFNCKPPGCLCFVGYYGSALQTDDWRTNTIKLKSIIKASLKILIK